MVEPDYYAKNGLSPLEAFEKGLLSKEEVVGFCKGNIIKYTVRAGEKTSDPLLDIVKAMDYLHHLHKVLKADETDNISDLDDKLEEVKNKIQDYKKGLALTDADLYNTDNVLTFNDEDLEKFVWFDTCKSKYGRVPKAALRPQKSNIEKKPEPDSNLKHTERLCGEPSDSWYSRLINKINGGL
ncbi:MAG: DUF3310 domain-containing protein [Methanobrevibacter sp.]|nr:DUF3310 domain-containing protein [Methanosphaera sp.]MBR0369208.1 DUF3310 domain-containing protein [Methanobrevibacter sp.]